MTEETTIIYKYKIKELLGRIPNSEHDEILSRIPELIGKCSNTMKTYIALPLDSKTDIPYGAMLVFEEILNVPARELCNFPIRKISYEELLKAPKKRKSLKKTDVKG